MEKNIGKVDKFIRVVLAAVIGYLYYLDFLSGWIGIVFMILAIILAFTSLINFCPLYRIIGINTCSTD